MMSRIKGRNTLPERKVRSELHKKGYRFRLHSKKLPGRPDIILPRYGVAIFVNGCFWHRHEECKYAYVPKSRKEFWQEKFKSNVERDKKKVTELTAAGWNVFVIWECETKTNVNLERKLNELIETRLVK